MLNGPELYKLKYEMKAYCQGPVRVAEEKDWQRDQKQCNLQNKCQHCTFLQTT